MGHVSCLTITAEKRAAHVIDRFLLAQQNPAGARSRAGRFFLQCAAIAVGFTVLQACSRHFQSSTKKLWHNRRSSRVAVASSDGRINGTVAGQSESDSKVDGVLFIRADCSRCATSVATGSDAVPVRSVFIRSLTACEVDRPQRIPP